MANGRHLVRDLGLLDSTMIVAGSMIGSGIFIVSADMSRQLGSPGWLLLAWAFTGLLTLAAALSYGELASMMPHAGGQYVYLREAYSPMWGFLYGWTLFLVIQTGTVAAVAVAFARFLGVLVPQWVGEDHFLINLGTAGPLSLSFSSAQLVAIGVIVLLTAANWKGIHQGKLIQNVLTFAKTAALVALIGLGLAVGRREGAALFQSDFWTPRGSSGVELGGLALAMVLGTAMVGSLFSSDAWNNITFTAGEVKNPKRNVPLSLAVGTGLVTVIYLLANVAYLAALPFSGVQEAPSDRVATAAMSVIFGEQATIIMAVAIMISTFGCANGLILAGARVYYAMALDGLFFQKAGALNKHGVPAWGLIFQAIWTCLLVLPRTFDPKTGVYGNLYSNLLDYVIFAVMLFYALTVIGLFILRYKRPEADRPYRAFGYPVVPALYVILALLIALDLLVAEKTRPNTVPGLIIVLTGVPVYLLWRRRNRTEPQA
ncbi:MAG: amino acid permease [Acidobacteria bacterium]|nr:MAG: amino acid permease [Acidobacteriota bacterium]